MSYMWALIKKYFSYRSRRRLKTMEMSLKRRCRRHIYMIFFSLLVSAAVSAFMIEWFHLSVVYQCSHHGCNNRVRHDVGDIPSNGTDTKTLEELSDFFNVSKSDLDEFLRNGLPLHAKEETPDNMALSSASGATAMITKIKNSLADPVDVADGEKVPSQGQNGDVTETNGDNPSTGHHKIMVSEAVWDKISTEGSPGVNLAGKWVPLSPRISGQLPTVSSSSGEIMPNSSEPSKEDQLLYVRSLPGFAMISSGFSKIWDKLRDITRAEVPKEKNLVDAGYLKPNEIYFQGTPLMEEMEWLLRTDPQNEGMGVDGKESKTRDDLSENLPNGDKGSYSVSIDQYLLSISDEVS